MLHHAIDCSWTPTASNTLIPPVSLSVLSRLQFSHQMPGLLWVVTKVRSLSWDADHAPAMAAASSVFWSRADSDIGHMVTRPRRPMRMSRGATRHYCCCCSFNITATGIVWRCVTGTGCSEYEWHLLWDTAWETPCTLPLLQAWSGSGEQRVITAETLATSPEPAPCHHHLSLHASL